MTEVYVSRRVEWFSALVMIGWGAVLIWPGETMTASPAYAPFLSVADERIWAMGCLGCGGVRVAALSINGLWHRSPVLRVITAAWSAAFWAYVTALFVLGSGDGPSTAVPVYLLLTAFDLNSAYRAGRETEMAERSVNGD